MLNNGKTDPSNNLTPPILPHAQGSENHLPMPVRKRKKRRGSSSNLLSRELLPSMQGPRHPQGEHPVFTEPPASAPRYQVEHLPPQISAADIESEAVSDVGGTTGAQVQPSASNKDHEERVHPGASKSEENFHIDLTKNHDTGSAHTSSHASVQRTGCENNNTFGTLGANPESHPPQGFTSHSNLPETRLIEAPRQAQIRRRRKLNPQPRHPNLLNGSAEESNAPPWDSGISMTQAEESASPVVNSAVHEQEELGIDAKQHEQAHPETCKYFGNPSRTSHIQGTERIPTAEDETDSIVTGLSKVFGGAVDDPLSSAVAPTTDTQVDTPPSLMVDHNSAPLANQEVPSLGSHTFHQRLLPSDPPEARNGQLQHEGQIHGISDYDAHGRESEIVAKERPPQTSMAPRASSGSGAGQNRPFRVTKPQRKLQSRGQMASGTRTNHSGPPKPTYADIFEQQLQSLRVSYYAESVRHESHFGAQVQIRDTRIADLEEQVKRAQDHVIEVERKDVERLNKAKQQRDAVRDLQKYVKGLSTDHAKFKETTKNHEKACSKILETRLSEFQNEKAELEQEFLKTVEKLEKSRRSTKELLQDCYTKLEVSESKRLGLLDNLRVQSALYEDERKKWTELEQQLTGSLQNVQLGLQNTEGILLEKLTSLESSVNDPAKDDKWGASLKECMDAVKGLQSSSLLTVKDAQKAEGMLRFIQKK